MKLIHVEIRNKNRKILILNDEEKSERVVLKDKISSIIEFLKNVFSFIKDRHAKQAAQLAQCNINNYKYFIKCDIRSFYESIDINRAEA